MFVSGFRLVLVLGCPARVIAGTGAVRLVTLVVELFGNLIGEGLVQLLVNKIGQGTARWRRPLLLQLFRFHRQLHSLTNARARTHVTLADGPIRVRLCKVTAAFVEIIGTRVAACTLNGSASVRIAR